MKQDLQDKVFLVFDFLDALRFATDTVPTDAILTFTSLLLTTDCL